MGEAILARTASKVDVGAFKTYEADTVKSNLPYTCACQATFSGLDVSGVRNRFLCVFYVKWESSGVQNDAYMHVFLYIKQDGTVVSSHTNGFHHRYSNNNSDSTGYGEPSYFGVTYSGGVLTVNTFNGTNGALDTPTECTAHLIALGSTTTPAYN